MELTLHTAAHAHGLSRYIATRCIAQRDVRYARLWQSRRLLWLSLRLPPLLVASSPPIDGDKCIEQMHHTVLDVLSHIGSTPKSSHTPATRHASARSNSHSLSPRLNILTLTHTLTVTPHSHTFADSV